MSTPRPAAVLVLAAGEGTRMKSATPKVLHRIGGVPLVGHAIRAARATGGRVIAIGTTVWASYARVVRADIMSLRQRDFIVAAQAVGATSGRVMFRHLIPNVLGPVVVLASLSIGNLIILESALSFLGVGVRDQPSWGQMLADATGKVDSAWWFMFFPGMALVLTVLAFNLVGDGMQDALNPKGSKNR